jgi:uncharacterized protein (TIGR03382 family)
VLLISNLILGAVLTWRGFTMEDEDTDGLLVMAGGIWIALTGITSALEVWDPSVGALLALGALGVAYVARRRRQQPMG